MLRRAFVVGNRTYESDDYCDLPGVSNDVEIIRQALSQIGFAGKGFVKDQFIQTRIFLCIAKCIATAFKAVTL